ncbi:hypothetical protein [Plantactinospora sp. KBS50]|uniref:hypothetical protein n=1 Tax=Plantactinospora sp. KBS50 TaxID=2024580 RepID=UPI000BAB1E57|nr:hypothetical protein [Plantactinospora sp. KBS50]ASW54427.1 hypothetical protein CIK06_09850 [Plantactinospora sp. KBS50]
MNVRYDAAQPPEPAGERLDPADYGPDAAREVTVPATDERRVVRERDIEDPADGRIDPDVLRDGGPADTPGMVTTTGGVAGPASVHRRPRRSGGDVAPTTTGDATTGGVDRPHGASTSDAAGPASETGYFTER